MRGYLDRIARPIELDVTLFVACFVGRLLVASLTVSGPTLQAARARATETLRHE
jgi:hypothetical protein